MAGDLVLLSGRLRELTGLTRTEALTALEQEMRTSRLMQKTLARLLNDPLPTRTILHRMRTQVVTALAAALFLGIAIGVLLAIAVQVGAAG